jgi:hypothetical protein
MALPAAGLAVALVVADFGVIDAQCPAPGDGQGPRVAHDVDGEAAAARGLAADRAIAELVGIGRVRGDRKPHGAAAARALESDRHGSAPVESRRTLDDAKAVFEELLRAFGTNSPSMAQPHAPPASPSRNT